MKENDARLAAALGRIKGVNVDEAAIRAHVMRPQQVVGVVSDRGWEDAPIVEHLPPRPDGNIPVDWSFPFWPDPSFNDWLWDLVTLLAYQAYVNANLFSPAGVTGPTLYHEAADALAYNFPISGNGWNSGDLTTMAGGAAWHMTVDEFLAVMGTFRRKDTIMSQSDAQTLLNNGFGIDWTVNTPLGTYYAKNGRWLDGSGHEEQTVAFYFPREMELVLFVNSPVTSADNFLYNIVSSAYTGNIIEFQLNLLKH